MIVINGRQQIRLKIKFEPINAKWRSFGWRVKEINGHNFHSLEKVLRDFKKNPKATVVVCRTIKGKGIKFMENNNLWHYRSPDKNELIRAKEELKI